MFSLKRIKIKEIKKFFRKAPRVLAEKSFLTLLGMFLIVCIFGAVIFYYYLNITRTSEVTEKEPLKFDTKTQQEILQDWQMRNESFLGTDLKKYPDPFKID
ncbi:MAG: hypothetical protein PHE52_00135 [Candidatus Pacebacteria bacterium]|nr:hypothetical protein [Candidatus Paceibacterota bacterium]